METQSFAEVEATKEQIAAARARQGHHPVEPDANKPETLRATLDLPVPVDAQLDLWLHELMNQISLRSAVPLVQQATADGMEFGTWRAIKHFEGGWTGKVLIQCRSKAELYKLHQAVHQKGVRIQGHDTAVSIHSDYVDLGDYLGGDPGAAGY